MAHTGVAKAQLNLNQGNAAHVFSQQRSAYEGGQKWIAQQKDALKTLAQESDYIGKTTVEIQKMKDARQMDAQALKMTLNMSPQAKQAFMEQADAIKKQRLEMIQMNYEQSRTFGAGAKDFFASYTETATNAAAQTKKVFGDAFKGMEDAFVQFAETGKINFKSMAQSIVSDLIRIQVQESITAPLAKAMSGAFNGTSGGSSMLSGLFSHFFADGGVMTGMGPIPLRKYAAGGIASTPQMSVFGEGSMPEAYVPLQDGRTIPVSMRGGGKAVVINQSINIGAGVQGTVKAEIQKLLPQFKQQMISSVHDAQLRGVI